MSKSGNNEDSGYKDGDRWRGAVSLGYDASGNHIRKKVSGRTRTEAVAKLRKLREQVDMGTVPDDKLTIKPFLDRWLTISLPGTVSESTEDSYNDTARLHSVPGARPQAADRRGSQQAVESQAGRRLQRQQQRGGTPRIAKGEGKWCDPGLKRWSRRPVRVRCHR